MPQSTRSPSPGALIFAAVLLLGAFVAPLPGQAQDAEAHTYEQADRLHLGAMATLGFVNHLDELPIIARMHGEAAGLRDWTDPRAFECWWLQAALLHRVGQHDEAVGYLEDAAKVALAQGNPALAAHTFLDAASVRKEQDRVDEVQVLIRRAHDLSLRRDLSGAERRDIERRISIR